MRFNSGLIGIYFLSVLRGFTDSLRCSDVLNNSSLPCVEVPNCLSSTVDITLDQKSDFSGTAQSYSELYICYDDNGFQITQNNYDQLITTQSSSINQCNDPVSNSNSASVYIAVDNQPVISCYTELDVSPKNISYHAGVYVPSILPISVQKFEIECSSSGMTSVTYQNIAASMWQVNFSISFDTISCPYYCPTPNSQCDNDRNSTAPGLRNDSTIEDIYRANFFRVTETAKLTGNGLCTSLQNDGKCETLAWSPTLNLYNTSNFGYLLPQFQEDVYSYDGNLDQFYIDLSIIIGIFFVLVMIIYVWFVPAVPKLTGNRDLGSIGVDVSVGPSVDISIRNLSYYVSESNSTKDQNKKMFLLPQIRKTCNKQLLHSLNLTIKRNGVTAIMGPSGAGKTTLMDLIVSRKQEGVVIGSILFNGIGIHNCKYSIAYVQSTDVQIAEFTVIQSLYFALLLRLNSGANIKVENRYQHCVRVAESVGLTDVLDTVIGSSLVKGISGGQMRRLTIATELLADPDIICLDEPTTGLDSTTSLQLAQTLNDLALQKNKTIVCTVHQPSDDMLNIWEQLILMGNGKVIYSGAINDLSGYLREKNQVPTLFNNGLGDNTALMSKSDCVEFVLELLHEENTLNLLADQWSKHDIEHKIFDGYDTSDKNIGEQSDSGADVSGARKLDISQVKILVYRHILYSLLSAEGIRSIIARNLIAGIVYSILYYQNYSIMMNTGYIVSITGKDFVKELYNVIGLVFSIITTNFMMNAVSVPALYQLNRFYSVEKEKRLYHFSALWIAFFIIDMIQQAFGALIFSALVYRMVELDVPFLTIFYPVVTLASLVSSSIAMWCGLINRNASSALAMFIVIAVFNMNFAGYLVSNNQMEDWLNWLLPTSFMYYSVGVLFKQVFTDVYSLGDILIIIWDYEDMTLNKCLWISFAWFIGVQLLLMVSMYPWPSRLKEFKTSDDYMMKVSEHGQNLFLTSADNTDLVNPLFETFDGIETSRHPSVDTSTTNKISRNTMEKRFSTIQRLSQRSTRFSHNRRSFSPSQSNSQMGSFHSCIDNRESYFDVTRKLSEEKRVLFCFQNITYTIPSQSENKFKGGEKRLLSNISGYIRPGEMMALMGPSGAGKTTLLNALAGRTNKGKLDGDMYINKIKCASLRSASSSTESPFYAFVMQDDHHNPMLTVKETLTFAAMLRKRTSNSADVMSYVDNIIELLGLQKIANEYVKTPETRTMSNGQLRRLTIGVEVVCAPSLIFCDEPTSGLDSYLALSVVNSLKSLAKAGHTILCTIHQPSAVTFEKFDKLILLSGGEMLYHGDIKESMTYFTNFGVKNTFSNSAEFFIDICSSLTPKIIESEANAKLRERIREEINTIISQSSDESKVHSFQKKDIVSITTVVSLNAKTISTLFQRDFSTNIRRAEFWIVCMLKALVTGVLTGLIFYNVDDKAIVPRLSAAIISFVYITLFLNEYTPLCHDEKLIFYRENEVNVVSAFAQWTVVGVIFSILLGISLFFYALPMYYITGLRSGSSYFMVFYTTMLLQLFSSILSVQLVVYLTPNATVTATIYPGFVLLIQSSLCGYSILLSTMKDWYKWLIYPNSMYWAMSAFFQNEWKDNPDTIAYDSLAEAFEYNNSVSKCFYMIVVICIVLRIATFFAMQFVTFSKS